MRIAKARQQREFQLAQRQKNRELIARRMEQKRLESQLSGDRVLLANVGSPRY